MTYKEANNDEARMTNDEKKARLTTKQSWNFGYLVIRHSFELRHSDFVILSVRPATAGGMKQEPIAR